MYLRFSFYVVVFLAAVTGGLMASASAPGKLDTTFAPLPMGSGSGGSITGGFVSGILQQPDGKILAVGNFNRVAGAGGANPTGGTACGRIARFNADGSIDESFDLTTGANASINTIALQSDGKILIGGSFTTYKGTGRGSMARLNVDGTLDVDFMAAGSGFNGSVHAIVVQPDGLILVGGNFNTFNSSSAGNLVRLQSNGARDTTFLNSLSGANNLVGTLALDGTSIYVAGNFTSVNGTPRARIARLQSSGALDAGFDPDTGFNDQVNSIAVQGDGNIVATGAFTTFRGNASSHIARITSGGAFDNGYGTGLNNLGNCVIIQPDGKAICSGGFTTAASSTRNRIARFNTDGSLDDSFDSSSGAGSQVLNLSLQDDGKLLAGGFFSTYDGQSIRLIARVLTEKFRPTLQYVVNGPSLELSWTGSFSLEAATDLSAPDWQSFPGTSPLNISTDTGTGRFFRLVESP